NLYYQAQGSTYVNELKKIIHNNALGFNMGNTSKKSTINTTGYLTRKSLEGEDQQLFHTFFIPNKQTVKATLLILHGMQEHSGRYTKIAEYFSEKGYAVLTYDHIGHGRT